MKIPVQLSKGLTEDQIKELESNLKHGVLAKQLRNYLKDGVKAMELGEESFDVSKSQLYSLIGQRRGFRQILQLLPEE